MPRIIFFARVSLMKIPLLVCLIFLAETSFAAAEFETPSTLDVKDMIPAQLISGPHHTVLSEVSNNGYQNKYTIESEFGQFLASGPFNLRIKIREMDALAYLETMSRTEVFVDSLVDAGVDLAKSIGGLFTDPVETVKGIPGGVVRLFAGYIDSAKRGANYAQNMGNESTTGELHPKEFKKKNYLVSDAERQWASELKTDPYTTNLKLRAAISRMSVVQFIGGLPVSYALPMALSVTVGVLGELGDKIYNLNAVELEVNNRTCLSEAGISEESIEMFFASDYMTPTMHSVFCAAISRLTGVKNLELVAVQLSEAESFRETRFVLNSLVLLTWYQNQNDSIDRITSKTRLPFGITSSNELVAILPADYLIWSESLASNIELFNDNKHPYAKKSLWLLGQTSEKARHELTQRGWVIHDRTNDEQMAKIHKIGLEQAQLDP